MLPRVDGCDLCPEGNQGCMKPRRKVVLGSDGKNSTAAEDLVVTHPAAMLCLGVQTAPGAAAGHKKCEDACPAHYKGKQKQGWGAGR